MTEKVQTILQENNTSPSLEKNNPQGVWFFAEHNEGELEKVSLMLAGEGKTLANKLGEELAAVIIGPQVKQFSEHLSQHGVDRVFTVENELLQRYSSELYVNVLAQLVGLNTPSLILFATTPIGNDLAPRLAARLRVGLVAHYSEIEVDKERGLVARKPIHGGKAHAIVTSSRRPLVATIDPQTLSPPKVNKSKGPQVIEPVIKLDPRSTKTRLIDYREADPCAVCVSEAEIVIGVGKGLGCVENLEAVKELARVLGASIGASRRATDEHWIADERRIGLTGKTISPKLYLTCGISGAFHHTLSIRGSRCIVAINTDRSAPIAKMADLMVVGDMQKVIPELTRQLRQMVRPSG